LRSHVENLAGIHEVDGILVQLSLSVVRRVNALAESFVDEVLGLDDHQGPRHRHPCAPVRVRLENLHFARGAGADVICRFSDKFSPRR
jgi:hypothetical protein